MSGFTRGRPADGSRRPARKAMERRDALRVQFADPAAQARQLRRALGILGTPTTEDAWRLAALFGDRLQVMEAKEGDAKFAAFICGPNWATILLPPRSPEWEEAFVQMLAHAVLHWHRTATPSRCRRGESEEEARRRFRREQEAWRHEAREFVAAWYEEERTWIHDVAHG